ncbi:MAG: glycosyltransferase family 2 protein [Cryobacterium sp.]|nr:glycosyltransferase family 2 protein [Cryobacterium sp.]
MTLRDEVGQLSWWTRETLNLTVLRRMMRVRRNQHLPRLRRSRRIKGHVWAVTMVRDEVDIIEHTVRHLLTQGVDHVLVADNLSTDGTRHLLDDLASRDPRVHIAVDDEPAYYQSEKMTRLARAAWRAGADWVIPFDADELWFACGQSLKEYLSSLSADSSNIEATIAMSHARMHDGVPTGGPQPPVTAPIMTDSTPTLPGKVAIRTHPLMVVVMGNHGAKRVGTVDYGLRLVHLQYRSLAHVERKAKQGWEALRLADAPEDVGIHWEALQSLSRNDLDEVWKQMQDGVAQPAVHFQAGGPMVQIQPLSWSSWDPNGQIQDPTL